MPHPLYLDTTDPQNPQAAEMPPGTPVDPTNLPDASTTEKGAVVLSDAAPPAIGSAGSIGASTKAARENHTHAHGDQAGGTLHANAVAGGAAGFMSGADKQALDNTPAAISAAVASHAGTGGTAHADATTGASGFMSASDKTKLDALLAAAQVPAGGATGYALKKASAADHDLTWAPDQTGGGSTPLEDGTPQPVGTPTAGVATTASRGDHVHAHGDQAGGTLHANAVAGGAAGFMSGADKQALDDTPAAISSAVSAEASARSTADGILADAITDEAAARAAGDVALSSALGSHVGQGGAEHANAVAGGAAGFMSGTDKQALDEAVQSASNQASSGATAVAEPEVGLFVDKTGTTLNLRSVCAQLGLESEVVDGSVRVRQRPRLWAPSRRSTVETYRRVRQGGRKTAGAVGDNAASGPDYHPATLLDNHGASDHLWPYMVWTGVDFYGIVHHEHRRLRGASLASTSKVKGFEWGHPVSAGDARIGNKFRWTLRGAIENAGWSNAFLDFALEVDPQVGDFAGPYLMRMLSPELGATWSGEREFEALVELVVTGPDSCSFFGSWKIFSSTGAVLREWDRGGKLASGPDWLANDHALQLRWRVDRDLAARANTFTGENQGERQGANVLRCHVDSYEFEPIGFREE